MADTVRAMEHSVRDIVGETDVESLSAGEVLDAALQRLPAVALACSFQKEESVLIDMLLERRPDARIFTLDTGRLHEETYDVMERIRRRYGVSIEVHAPEREAVVDRPVESVRRYCQW